jgi:hypothetical protein
MTIGIDFDGTCVTYEFPAIGKDIGAVHILRQLTDQGHKLILFTMRSDITAPESNDVNIVLQGGNYLTDAINWFNDNNIPLYGIQTNPTQHTWTTSPKAYCDLYIDDAALGCPLIHIAHARPHVDWLKVKQILYDKQILQ